jgi:hypothetical protein
MLKVLNRDALASLIADTIERQGIKVERCTSIGGVAYLRLLECYAPTISLDDLAATILEAAKQSAPAPAASSAFLRRCPSCRSDNPAARRLVRERCDDAGTLCVDAWHGDIKAPSAERVPLFNFRLRGTTLEGYPFETVEAAPMAEIAKLELELGSGWTVTAIDELGPVGPAIAEADRELAAAEDRADRELAERLAAEWRAGLDARLNAQSARLDAFEDRLAAHEHERDRGDRNIATSLAAERRSCFVKVTRAGVPHYVNLYSVHIIRPDGLGAIMFTDDELMHVKEAPEQILGIEQSEEG